MIPNVVLDYGARLERQNCLRDGLIRRLLGQRVLAGSRESWLSKRILWAWGVDEDTAEQLCTFRLEALECAIQLWDAYSSRAYSRPLCGRIEEIASVVRGELLESGVES